MAGQEPWKGKQVQGTATQPTTLLNTLGQVNTTAEVYPPSGHAAGAAGTLQWCSRLASRAHRAGSHGSQESRSVLPGQSWSTGPSPQGPIVLRIGIHHVAPSLVLPASLLPSSPSFIKRTVSLTTPVPKEVFFGASWRAGSGRRCWKGFKVETS